MSVSIGFAVVAWGQQSIRIPEPGREQLGGLMRAKLSSSQRVVEGLMAGDFDLIRKGGEDMIKIWASIFTRAEHKISSIAIRLST